MLKKKKSQQGLPQWPATLTRTWRATQSSRRERCWRPAETRDWSRPGPGPGPDSGSFHPAVEVRRHSACREFHCLSSAKKKRHHKSYSGNKTNMKSCFLFLWKMQSYRSYFLLIFFGGGFQLFLFKKVVILNRGFFFFFCLIKFGLIEPE